MDIGEKLKNARSNAGMTQEFIAEQINVSRQTVSNWENNRTYPDIVSVIRLSDLYAVSLDALLKEDEKMLEHLEESTNVVRSRGRFSRLILISVYLVIWALLMVLFWFGISPGDAMGYSLIAFYLVLPVTTIVISFLIGRDKTWGRSKWLMIPFFGLMFMLAEYATFKLSNMLSVGIFRLPDLGMLATGGVCAAVGMLPGVIASLRRHVP